MERIRCFFVYGGNNRRLKDIKSAIRNTLPAGVKYHDKKHGEVDREIVFASDDTGIEPSVIEWRRSGLTYFVRCKECQYEQVNRAFVLAGFFKSDLPF